MLGLVFTAALPYFFYLSCPLKTLASLGNFCFPAVPVPTLKSISRTGTKKCAVHPEYS
jgi:hypothetical protein